MEVDRVLRPGGYWILSGPPINWRRYWKGWERTKEDLNVEQNGIESIVKRLCWKKLVEKDDIAIWQKPINHFNCKRETKLAQNTNFCPDKDADKAWLVCIFFIVFSYPHNNIYICFFNLKKAFLFIFRYTNMDTCLTPLPEVSSAEKVAGDKIPKWPERLHTVPPRILRGTVPGITGETFQENSELWKKRVSYYKTVNNQLGQPGRYRNILDMNAHLGGFAAALVKDPVWVMNVVPIEARVNTLGAIYERGLIGTYQSWCEAMSTYPRTYDLIHADSLFTLYEGR